jgi:hypothetical protein
VRHVVPKVHPCKGLRAGQGAEVAKWLILLDLRRELTDTYIT